MIFTRKELSWIRTQIAIVLTSKANTLEYPEYPDTQDDVWDNDLFDFELNCFEEKDHEEIKLVKKLFDNIRELQGEY